MAPMNRIKELDQIRRRMVEELTQIPEYRALKAMERLIADLSAIYENVAEAPAHMAEDEHEEQKIAEAIEKHVRGDASPLIVKNAGYIPVQRVA